jgi:hypothetical protein
VVQHVVEAAVVGQAVEKRANGVFGAHDNPAWQEGDPSIRPSGNRAKFSSWLAVPASLDSAAQRPAFTRAGS